MENLLFLYHKNALLNNLCKEWDAKWNACRNDKEKLMRLVLMQQSAAHFADYCYRGKGLTKEYCIKEFGEFLNGRVFNDCDGVEGYTYGMFIDAPANVKLDLDVAQFLWCDNVNIIIPKTKASKIYISNNSTATISCDGYNSLTIMLFDTSKIVLEDIDVDTNITIYKYSDKCEVELGKYCFGKVNEFTKELKL